MDRTTTHASLSMGNKKNSSIDRCFLLYEKGKIKNEVNKLIIQKNYELKEKQLLSKCTFKPITNSVRFITPTSIKDSNKSSSIYDRNEYWNKNKLEKYIIINFRIEKGKNMILRNENYPFHPQVFYHLFRLIKKIPKLYLIQTKMSSMTILLDHI